MLARLEQNAALPSEADFRRVKHILMVLEKTDDPARLRGLPGAGALQEALARRRKKLSDLHKTPIGAEHDGTLFSWVMPDPDKTAFERNSLLRQGLQALLAERPAEIGIAVAGRPAQRRENARAAVYAAWVNGARLPDRKKKSEGEPLARIRLFGMRAEDGFARERAVAGGNLLCRELTVLPPNELTPAEYRSRIRRLARERGWRHEEYDLKRLRRMGAGAFTAVARGSASPDAAIVRLSYRPRGARETVALVGKGICFDTGGHNLKTARYMEGMHKDMNGSAVVLGVLLAASELRLPLALDGWLAIARNDIGPGAYHQNEIVTALNGTTIEVVHTDAEGRMVLADTLALAARGRPDLIIDFATLTGSMHVAVGERYSGVFATTEVLTRRAVSAGAASGERVCAFPMDEDYEAALESEVADVKQCTLGGEADHILAARFLRRFTDGRPWIHVDLSAARCKGGLGAVGTDINGFGVAWAMACLEAGLQARH